MVFFKKYRSIPFFLLRFTLLEIGPLHIRTHKIIGEDVTSLLHNHPFNYISIIIRGGYTETVKSRKGLVEKRHGLFSFVSRRASTYHRIDTVLPETTTLFFAFGRKSWNAIQQSGKTSEMFIQQRIINDINVWSKNVNGIWFIGHENKRDAEKESRHSIYQTNK
ncbi:unnamed protein product [marine sediment metagenome]|uniref:Uncharacterized protein n=1 Tax=marine sediment metagenome TaxID=412755 RepID=X0S0Q0_9ZZZZ